MAGQSTLPPSQPSQPSRKGKKAWRKNVNLTELHEGLEHVREEIIQGGIVAELSSDALFTLDTVGDSQIRHKYVSKHKPLKADQILAERSAVPSVSLRKRPTDAVFDEDGVVVKKHKKGGVSHREYERLRKMAYGGESVHKNVVENEGDATYDPWDAPIVEKKPEYDFLEEKKPLKEPVTLKHQAVRLSEDGREVKAVRRPAAEKSYNPTLPDWYGRLEREHLKEEEKEQKRLEEAVKKAELLAKIEKVQEEEEQAKLVDSEWESEWEGFASETEAASEWANKKMGERKTKVQRNKIKRRKEEEARKKHDAKMKAKARQAERIKALAKEVKEKEDLKAQEQAEKALVVVEESSDDGDDIAPRRKGFGKAPIPEAPLEVLLPEELPDSLRSLKPQGNVMTDRYRSLLLRGKVESRKQHQRKNPQKQLTEKWSYKDWKLK